MEDEPRIFGGKEDANFWADKPIQKGHPKFKESKKVKCPFCGGTKTTPFTKAHKSQECNECDNN